MMIFITKILFTIPFNYNQRIFSFDIREFPITLPVFCRSKLLLAITSRPGGRSYRERGADCRCLISYSQPGRGLNNKELNALLLVCSARVL
jgi:hypothetical protein